jgi:hypothetical protein
MQVDALRLKCLEYAAAHDEALRNNGRLQSLTARLTWQ